MKKIVLFLIVGFAVIFGGCNKKTISTQYTIGCRGYQYIPIQESEWNELQSYFINNVEYDKLVTFESISLAANDAKAREYFDKQIQKVDTAYVCSLLHSTDYFDYGIATLNTNGSYRNIKVIRFSENGTQDLTAH